MGHPSMARRKGYSNPLRWSDLDAERLMAIEEQVVEFARAFPRTAMGGTSSPGDIPGPALRGLIKRELVERFEVKTHEGVKSTRFRLTERGRRIVAIVCFSWGA